MKPIKGIELRIYFGLVIIFIQLNVGFCWGQKMTELTGKVTYKSSQNVYVQFDSTTGINPGDTLFIKTKGKINPAIVVNFISSRSCAGAYIGNNSPKIGDEIIAVIKIKTDEEKIVANSDSNPISLDSTINTSITPIRRDIQTRKSNNSSGRISIQSYSNFIPNGSAANSQRWRYTFRYDNSNIEQSRFSFSSYTSYIYRVEDWQMVKTKPWNNLKVYDLSVGYDFGNDTKMRIGRYLNPRISNISSVDGLQLQSKLANYFGGLIIGSRPNFSTLSFDSKLFEYGGYIGRVDSLSYGFTENTIGFFEQMNNSQTDRRFAYFQHTNSIVRNLNVFVSSEVDFYTVEKGNPKSDFSLTSLFLSSRYSPSRTFSFSFSYDARKNVIYYETFKTAIDSIIENETRQGIRFGTNIKMFNSVFVGLNAGYRFLKKDTKPSKNFNGFLTYSQIPWIEISPTISYSLISSSYIDGKTYGISLSKYFSMLDFSISAAFSYLDYSYLSVMTNLIQKNFSLDLSGRIYGPVSFSLNYEGTFERRSSYSTLLFGASYRF